MGIVPGRQSLELSFEEKIRKEGKFVPSAPASPLASHRGQQGVFMVRPGPAGPQKMEMYLFHLIITSGDLSTIGFFFSPRGAQHQIFKNEELHLYKKIQHRAKPKSYLSSKLADGILELT